MSSKHMFPLEKGRPYTLLTNTHQCLCNLHTNMCSCIKRPYSQMYMPSNMDWPITYISSVWIKYNSQTPHFIRPPQKTTTKQQQTRKKKTYIYTQSHSHSALLHTWHNLGGSLLSIHHLKSLTTWGADIRFISSRRVCRGPSAGRLFLRASSRKEVHCWIRLNSMNTSTIWKHKSVTTL